MSPKLWVTVSPSQSVRAPSPLLAAPTSSSRAEVGRPLALSPAVGDLNPNVPWRWCPRWTDLTVTAAEPGLGQGACPCPPRGGGCGAQAGTSAPASLRPRPAARDRGGTLLGAGVQRDLRRVCGLSAQWVERTVGTSAQWDRRCGISAQWDRRCGSRRVTVHTGRQRRGRPSRVSGPGVNSTSREDSAARHTAGS